MKAVISSRVCVLVFRANKHKRIFTRRQTHLCCLGLAGVAEQGVTGSQVFGRVDAICAHDVFEHCYAALLLHCPVSREKHTGELSEQLDHQHFNIVIEIEPHWIPQL